MLRQIAGRLLKIRSIALAVTVLMLFGPAPVFGPYQPREVKDRPMPRGRAPEAYGSLPLYFVENKGQVDSRVAYYAQIKNTTAYFTPEGVTYAIATGKLGAATAGHPGSIFNTAVAFGSEPREPSGPQRWAVKLDFVNANPGVQLTAADRTPTLVSYFKGRQDQWKTGLHTYSTVVYRDLWPGIDLVYVATNDHRLKYTFLVKPGADPSLIRLAYRGVTDVKITDAGQIQVSTPIGSFRDDKPYVYQEIAGRRVEVKSTYDLTADRPTGTHVYGFRLDAYDTTRPIVIDPALAFSSYLGGNTDDRGYRIALDGTGNIYLAGVTTSPNFPTTAGAFDLTYGGGATYDVFVVKLNPTASATIFSTYLGGGGFEDAGGIALGTDGSIYVVGQTTSGGFPTTPGAYQTTLVGPSDAFVTRLNSTGTGLVYSTLVGGNGDDRCRGGVAVDATGSAFVACFTASTDFPTTPGAFQGASAGGGGDAAVFRVDAAGTTLLYSTYLGGNGSEEAFAIKVDGGGNAFVIGTTSSTNFPTSGAVQPAYGGAGDAFLTKLSSNGTSVLFSTYLGGSGFEDVGGLALDSTGNVYVSGQTGSIDFPTTPGAFQTVMAGSSDGFVTKLNSAGSGLVFSTFLGGSGGDSAGVVAVDGGDRVYLAGLTVSTDFPTTPGAFQPSFGGGALDTFVARMNPAGSALVYSSYLGGSGHDQEVGITVDNARNAYVVGLTDSSNFPTTPGVVQTANAGGVFDAFLARVDTNVVTTVSIDVKPGNFPNALPDIDPLNLSSNGVTPLAIFTTPTFDASTVTVSSVLFAGAPALRSAMEDVDNDGDLDMVLHFDTQALDLNCAPAPPSQAPQTVTLTAQAGGEPIQGTDSVRVLKNKNKQKCP